MDDAAIQLHKSGHEFIHVRTKKSVLHFDNEYLSTSYPTTPIQRRRYLDSWLNSAFATHSTLSASDDSWLIGVNYNNNNNSTQDDDDDDFKSCITVGSIPVSIYQPTTCASSSSSSSGDGDDDAHNHQRQIKSMQYAASPILFHRLSLFFSSFFFKLQTLLVRETTTPTTPTLTPPIHTKQQQQVSSCGKSSSRSLSEAFDRAAEEPSLFVSSHHHHCPPVGNSTEVEVEGEECYYSVCSSCSVAADCGSDNDKEDTEILSQADSEHLHHVLLHASLQQALPYTEWLSGAWDERIPQ